MTATMTAVIERLSTVDLAPRQGLTFVDTAGLHALYERLAFKANMVLVGPKGIGKSLSCAAYAAKVDCPILTFDCSEDVRRSHLLGMFVLRGGETPFVLGPLTTAFEVANEVGQCILVLEEINTLSPQMQKVLNSSLDFRKRVDVPECKTVFRLNPGAKLWIVGSMNTAGHGGTYELNEDLKSRLRLVPMDYPKPEDERKVLEALLKADNVKVDRRVVDGVLTLAHETRQKSLDYALSTRDLVQVLEDQADVGLEKALWLITGKFDGDDRATIIERINSIFGVKLAA